MSKCKFIKGISLYLKISVFIFFDKTYLQKHHWVMIKNISSNKTKLRLRFVFKNKDLKSKVRRISLKWILNQLTWILDERFRTLLGWYQPTQLYLRAGFLLRAQVSFFLICVGDSTCVGYHLWFMSRFVRWNRICFIKLNIKTKKVIDRGKRNKTLSEVKSVENIYKNLQSFLGISPAQKEVIPSCKNCRIIHMNNRILSD